MTNRKSLPLRGRLRIYCDYCCIIRTNNSSFAILEATGLYDSIKGLGSWWHHLGSTWLVDTNLNAAEIWRQLEPHVDTNDSMLIIGVTADRSGWLSNDAWGWINDQLLKAA
jgi:hypothetical protein